MSVERDDVDTAAVQRMIATPETVRMMRRVSKLRLDWVVVSALLAMACTPGSSPAPESRADAGGELDAERSTPAVADASDELELDAQAATDAPFDAADVIEALDAQAADTGSLWELRPEQFPAYPEAPVPAGNPKAAARSLLGKVLFWDEQLSSDDSVACGTCHRPAAGGADPRPAAQGYIGHPGADAVRGSSDDPRGSPGIRLCDETDAGVRYREHAVFGAEPQVTRRRSMSFLDAMFWPELFWDGRTSARAVDPDDATKTLPLDAGALESQALVPLFNAAEMACEGRRTAQLVDKLAQVVPLARARQLPDDLRTFVGAFTRYSELFAAAFGDAQITLARVALAIAQYERVLRSDQTPWDRWRAGDSAALSPAARRGLDVFMRRGNCGCCHAPPLFGSTLYVNDGFSLSTWDLGRAEVTGAPNDTAAFRVPSLRNVGLREAAGLLHDGVGAGASLETLIQRYTQAPLAGGRAGLCLRIPLSLSAAERADLLEFVREGLTDPRVAAEQPPFDRPRLSDEAAR